MSVDLKSLYTYEIRGWILIEGRGRMYEGLERPSKMYGVLKRPAMTEIMKDFTSSRLKRLSWDGAKSKLYGGTDFWKRDTQIKEKAREDVVSFHCSTVGIQS